MAPAVTHCQHPASILFPVMAEDPGLMMTEPMQFPNFHVPVTLKMQPIIKRLEVDLLDRRRMLQVFRKAHRYLRAALFRVLNRCVAAVKAFRSMVFPRHRMAHATHVVNMASVALYNLKQKHWEELGSTFQGVMWTSGCPQEVQGCMCAPDERSLQEEYNCMSGPDETFDISMKESVTEELEVPMADWLEWEKSDAEVEELCGDVPLAVLKSPLSCPEKSSDPSPTAVSSEEEVEWDSDSSWDDDDGNEDWDEEPDSNTQLWESFMCNDDPYNPFRCSSNTAVNDKRPKTPESCTHSQMSGRKAGVGRADEKLTVGNTKVRFSDVVKVHPLVTWSFASRAARDGSCWQRMALDRERFKRRVEVVGEVLSPCLETEHRARVWRRLQMV